MARPRRAANGDGSTYREPDGAWRVRFYHNGRAYRSRGRTKAEAQQRAAARLRLLEAGVDASRAVTLGQELEGWLRDARSSELRPLTLDGYERAARRYILPRLGRVRLLDLTPGHLRDLYAALTVGRSQLGVCRTVLRGTLTRAVLDGRVSRNVAMLVPLPKRPPPAPRERLTLAEARRILAAIGGHPYGPLWAFLLATGCRLGEGLGLRWEAVDLEHGTVQIAATVQRLPPSQRTGRQGWELAPPKTRAGYRVLPLGPSLAGSLAARRQPRGFVFASSSGGPLDRSRVSRAWRALLAEQGIRPLRLHDLRHGLATLYRELGADLRTIQDQLGHSSLRVTSDLYTARVMVPLRDAAERLERALAAPTGPATAPAGREST